GGGREDDHSLRATREAAELKVKIDAVTTKLIGARSASPVRPCPTVQPEAIDAPTPRPSPPARRCRRTPDAGTRSATGPPLHAASAPPARIPKRSRTSQAGKARPGTASRRPVVPGTTARPKPRPAAAEIGHARAAVTPIQKPVLRHDHAPARPSPARARPITRRRPATRDTIGVGAQDAVAGRASW